MHITLRPALETDPGFARSVRHRAYHDVVIEQFGQWDEAAQDEFFNAAWSSARTKSLGVMVFGAVTCASKIV